MSRLVPAAAWAAAVALAAALLVPGLPGIGHPPVPQRADGIGQCWTCHASGPASGGARVPPAPADHATYAETTCATCHPAIAGVSPTAVSYSKCVTCHSKEDAALTLASGQAVSTFVDLAAFRASVHRNLACVMCHARQETIPHPPVAARTSRALSLELSAACATCHQGRERGAAACTDCHTVHAVAAPTHGPLVAGPLETPRRPTPADRGLGWVTAALLGWAGLAAVAALAAGWWTIRRRARLQTAPAGAGSGQGGNDE